jgi:hypothetical protein
LRQSCQPDDVARRVFADEAVMNRINRGQIVIGVTSLATGLLVYLVARPSSSVWFLPSALHLDIPLSPVVRHASGSVPTFTHALAFSLLSAGVIASRRLGGAVICTAWFLLESAFEIGQRADISPWLTSRLPVWFDHIWLLANTSRFFARGTFDVSDLAAGAAGAALAFVIICRTQPQR